jgi:FecR protein
MSDESKIRELFTPLDETPIDVEGRRFKVNRAKVVAAILNAPAALATDRALRSRRIAMLAMAAGFVVVAGAAGWVATHRPSSVAALGPSLQLSDVRGHVSRLRGGSQIAVAPGESTTVSAEGVLFTAAESEASVRTARGLEVTLFENSRILLSDLNIDQPTNAVHLESGAIRCRVPHLEEGQHFSVITPDATVVVHGTVFRVEVGGAAGSATRTCVRVEEGVVSVSGSAGEARVTASQSWGCDPPAERPGATAPLAPPVEATAKSGSGPAARAATDSPRDSTKDAPKAVLSTLNEENRLFQAGLAAERSGDTRTAAASFELLLSRYPQSPLAADARTALSRVGRGAKSVP